MGMVANLPEHLVQQAMALSAEQRAALLHELRMSLLSEEDAAMVREHLPKWEATWRRFQEHPEDFVDALEALDQIEAQHDQRANRVS